MERIAPLAKILAEANGIDWQKLNGTGSGGMIVEQDILNYLSRVMSGEEDPPSTPVDPTPAGWTGDEIPSADMLNKAGMNADMLSRAGVDTDITAFVEQARTASPQVPATPAASTLADEDLEFELDDEDSAPDAPAPAFSTPSFTDPAPMPAVAVAPAVPEVTAPAFATPVFSAPMPTAPMPAAPEPVMQAPVAPEPVMQAPVVEAPRMEAPVIEAPVMEAVAPQAPAAPQVADIAAPAAATGLAAGLGSLLSRLYQKPAPEAAPQATAPDITAPDITAPAITAPDINTPAFTAPVAAEPEVTAPPVHLPDLTAPAVQIPDVQTPDVQVAAEAEPSSVPAFHFDPTPAAQTPVAQPEVPETTPEPEQTGTPAMPTWTDGREADDHAWTEPTQTEQTQAAAPATDAAPLEDAAPVAEIAPVEAASTGDVTTDETPVEVAEAAPAAAEDTVDASPTEQAPVEEAAIEAAPVEPDPVDEPAAESVEEPVSAQEPVEEVEAEVTAPVAAELTPAADDTQDAESGEAPIEVAPIEELQPEPAQEPQVLVAPVAVADTNSTQVVHAQGEGSPANAVWFGAYLRRDANVTALHDLQGQVSAALDQALPLGLLVARAAQRHADTLSLGSVAVQGESHAHPVGTGSLRDALAQLDTAYDGDTPDLLIVDAGAHGLDDLHYPHTLTLSVGRMQNGRAPLSLNGDVDAARAAKFLAQVAETLEQPILLVL
ncbi:E3 binding domain-containing protein [Deinococcus sp. A31D244]|uniref:E3 binding domain-containing protein n=1 Tax=Deinococcus sp. A31D244 TaxID=3397675 RepID=UPI0039E052B8